MLTDDVTIYLNDAEQEKVIKLATEHIRTAKNTNSKLKYGQLEQNKQRDHLVGYTGEVAIAQFLNYDMRYFSYNKKRNDVLGYEIRTTTTNYLITHDDCKDGLYIAIKFCDLSKVIIKGWRKVDSNYVARWRDDWKRPCYTKNHSNLWPINALPATPELIAHQHSVYA